MRQYLNKRSGNLKRCVGDPVAYDRIIKRDGRTVRFDRSRISDAIYKAIRAAGSGTERDAENITDLVIKEMEDVIGGKTPTVEQVQDTVEGCLMRSGMQRVAKAYILYRKQHADMRTIQSLMNAQEIIEGYVSMNDWMVKENSNMSYSLQGLNFYISSAVVSNYWLNKIYPDEIKDAHSEGDFHLHDLGTLGAYCVGWDMRDLLVSGFGHVRGKIASRPAKHFRAALGQLVNFFYTLQGEAAGAQAFSNFDTYLAPFIRHDSLSKSEVKQALQEFVFNMNVPTRVGFQTPFTNVTLDLVVPSYMRDEPVIIGGLPTDDTYKDFQNEMDIFNGAFAEVMTEGDAEGRVFTFPIPTYNIVKGFDWDAPVLENIFKMTAKYGRP
jgi:ribonucleoside-triphosphate reductase